eukprot:365703-Chlamydomonas_euryale.AAC.3
MPAIDRSCLICSRASRARLPECARAVMQVAGVFLRGASARSHRFVYKQQCATKHNRFILYLWGLLLRNRCNPTAARKNLAATRCPRREQADLLGLDAAGREAALLDSVKSFAKGSMRRSAYTRMWT